MNTAFKKFHSEILKSAAYWDKAKDIINRCVYGKESFKQGSLGDAMMSVFVRAICRNIKGGSEYAPVFGKKEDITLTRMLLQQTGREGDKFGIVAAANAIARFMVDQGKTYVLAQDFFDKFKRVSLDSLRVSHLPETFSGFIHFPYPVKKPNLATEVNGRQDDRSSDNLVTAPITGLYVSLGYMRNLTLGFDAADMDLDCSLTMNTRVLSLGFIDINGKHSADVYLQIPPGEENSTIISLFQNGDRGIPESESLFLIRLCINLMVYIQSGNPDLREFRNQITYRSPTSTKPTRACADLSSETIYLVGYNWKKESLISYDEKTWNRIAHLRWQPHGPGLTLRKLILVEESQCTRQATHSIRKGNTCQNPLECNP